MKKMICVLAMALLVAGASQAQVRKMFVHLNNDSIVKIKAADIQDVTFEMDYSPTTMEEAEAILLDSYWRLDGPLSDTWNENFECPYLSVIPDGGLTLYWIKVKDSPTDEKYAPYAGKYVFALSLGWIFMKTPTEFNIMGDGLLIFNCTNLLPDSFDMTRITGDENDPPKSFHCVRVEPWDPSECEWGGMPW